MKKKFRVSLIKEEETQKILKLILCRKKIFKYKSKNFSYFNPPFPNSPNLRLYFGEIIALYPQLLLLKNKFKYNNKIILIILKKS